MSTIVVPAIIAQTQLELDDMLEKLRGKAHRVMLDIMDGRFVESESLNFEFKLPSHFEYEAHLMVEDPLNLVQSLIGKVHIVILHVETLDNIEAAINQVKSNGLKVVLALNPESDVSILYPYLEKIDGVLVMTVKPGKYGGSFLPEILEKCKEIRILVSDLPIEVDGGMIPETAKAAKEAGASIIASGSFIMKSKNVKEAIKQLSE